LRCVHDLLLHIKDFLKHFMKRLSTFSENNLGLISRLYNLQFTIYNHKILLILRRFRLSALQLQFTITIYNHKILRILRRFCLSTLQKKRKIVKKLQKIANLLENFTLLLISVKFLRKLFSMKNRQKLKKLLT
jgi:hypothetical protein